MSFYFTSYHFLEFDLLKISMTSTCPTFLEGPHNATSSFCALASCANNSAVMASCCGGSRVVPYYFDSGFVSVNNNNDTSGNALWCHVSNETTPAWLTCVNQFNTTGVSLCGNNMTTTSGAPEATAMSCQTMTMALSLLMLLQIWL